LNRIEWVDRNGGVARIPISDTFDIMVEGEMFETVEDAPAYEDAGEYTPALDMGNPFAGDLADPEVSGEVDAAEMDDAAVEEDADEMAEPADDAAVEEETAEDAEATAEPADDTAEEAAEEETAPEPDANEEAER